MWENLEFWSQLFENSNNWLFVMEWIISQNLIYTKKKSIKNATGAFYALL